MFFNVLMFFYVYVFTFCVFVCVQPALVVLLCLNCVFCVRLTHLIKIAAATATQHKYASK